MEVESKEKGLSTTRIEKSQGSTSDEQKIGQLVPYVCAPMPVLRLRVRQTETRIR